MAKGVRLDALVSPWLQLGDSNLAAVEVTHLEIDSRRVGLGDTFVAIVGHSMDGRLFIEAAVEQGANLVLAQADQLHPNGYIDLSLRCPVIYVANLHDHLSELASRLYVRSDNQLIAVTGTNGKTTITQLMAQWLDLLEQKAAVMGTTGNGFLHNLLPAKNTTADAIQIQAMLADFAEQGARFTALEVSSHGLVQGRVKALNFSVGVFSNLSRDHLDYHGTMAEYGKAKLSLFTQHRCRHCVINADDPVGLAWLGELPDPIAVSLISPPSSRRALWATAIDYSESGIEIDFDGFWGAGHFKAPLVGEFNASNLLLALAALLALGCDKHSLLNQATHLRPVIGRMELFQRDNYPKIVVDYAHTPDALEKALTALRVHCQGKLWVIFGCGGDRDKGKRPLMAGVAERFADQIILSDDNPRSEDPQCIVEDMLKGLAAPDAAHIKHSRFDAAHFALSQAKTDDIILLAGKGHEDYQVLAKETIHYSDRDTAQQLLGISE
jgi:UDP-N-acetylmuramoyl-L-alanyl-D-glutamate--2,6-diaminopimelate ligase